MKTPQIPGSENQPFGAKEATEALNEQGFLLQQIVREKIQPGMGTGDGKQNHWNFVESEYPVIAVDGSQTKIDLVLRHREAQTVYVCLECKRPNRKYKAWLFFDKVIGAPEFFLESFEFNPTPEFGHKHEIRTLMDRKCFCPIFNYYVEAAVKMGRDSASSTETIEKSFRQLIAGHTGLMTKLQFFTLQNMFFRSIPVLVTTAQIFEAQFDKNKIHVATGTIEESNLKLVPLDFCAVNYHADDTLALKQQRTGNRKSDVVADLTRFQIRTVFVVHVTAINRFLNWAGANLIQYP